jgi:hypothetical protein
MLSAYNIRRHSFLTAIIECCGEGCKSQVFCRTLITVRKEIPCLGGIRLFLLLLLIYENSLLCLRVLEESNSEIDIVCA